MDMSRAKLIELWSTLVGPLYSSRLTFILIPPGLSRTTPLLLFNWVHGSLVGTGTLNFLTCGLITLNSWSWPSNAGILLFMVPTCSLCVGSWNCWKGLWRSSINFIIVTSLNELPGLRKNWIAFNPFFIKTMITSIFRLGTSILDHNFWTSS